MNPRPLIRLFSPFRSSFDTVRKRPIINRALLRSRVQQRKHGATLAALTAHCRSIKCRVPLVRASIHLGACAWLDALNKHTEGRDRPTPPMI
jgi:hypothetical protein